jgi:hypothetical protein
VPSFAEIEKHLSGIASKKKFSKYIIVGDFNFDNTDWFSDSSGNSSFWTLLGILASLK